MLQIEQFKSKIKEEALVHQSLLEYLGISDENIEQQAQKEERSEKLFGILKDKSTLTNKCEFREFLVIISHLLEIHQSKKEIKCKIEILFSKMKKDIKNIFSEEEIFHIFKLNKNNFILLILVEQNILSVETMIKNINIQNECDMNIIKFFYPEIRKYDENYFNELMINENYKYEINKFVEENDQSLEFIYEIRKEGVTNPEIIKLIKEDKIKEFILFVEHHSIDLNNKIQKEKTLFDAYTRELTPIEYSALFGSVTIFKYLYMKKVNINFIDEWNNQSIIEYAVEGRNYEIIHILEDRKEIIEELNNQRIKHKILELSVKMHYNEIFEYFIGNYNWHVTKEIINIIIIYRNYLLFDQLIERNQIEFNDESIITEIFFRFCKNENEEIVKIMITQPNLDINSKDYIFDHRFEMKNIQKKLMIRTTRQYSLF